MKLLLTSAGIKNASIHDALEELLGKPIADANALAIPTGSRPNPNGAIGMWRMITGQSNTPLCEMGWKSLGVLELTALPSIDEASWVPALRETDALLVGGGHSLYLNHWMRQSRFAELLPSLRAVYVGVSAGSMALRPNIGVGFGGWTPPNGDLSALGVVDFSIFPHVDHPDMPDNSMAEAKKWPPPCRGRRTRSTIRPPSGGSTARSTSSPKDTGTCSTPDHCRFCNVTRDAEIIDACSPHNLQLSL